MKKKFRNVYPLFFGMSCLLISDANASGISNNTPAPAEIDAELTQTVGVLEVFPFEDSKKSVRCTTFHLGDGYMATAGHCFLGAYDCNQALVRWANSDKISQCTRVIYSFASESIKKLDTTNRDLTIFRVDAAPPQKLKVTQTHMRSLQAQSLAATGISVQLKRGRVTSRASKPCTLITGSATNIFGQPKPNDSVQHNCSVGSYSAGTPIVDATTGELLAIQQSSTLMPAIDTESETYLEEVNFAKTLTEHELSSIINKHSTSLRNLSVGGFAPEVFYSGFRDSLNMKVATLGIENNINTVSFIPHNGVDTQVEILDGDGRKTIISGPRRANLEQRLEFKAPVQISLKSTNIGMAPSLWLEDINYN